MTDYCSPYCKRFEECSKLGITDFMKVVPKHPRDLERKWCESFEEAEEKDDSKE